MDKFLDVGAKWLFFLDSDVLCPELALERLMSHNVPIVGGLYYRRHLDQPGTAFHPAVWKLAPAGAQVTCPACRAVHTIKEGKYQPILNPPPDRLIEVDAQGAGCLLVHRRVFEKVEKPWFRWSLGWVDPGVSEDFYFMERCIDAGFKPLCDTGIRCGHIGDLVVDGEGRTASPGV